MAFIHYRIDVDKLRSQIPGDLAIDEFDGSAWVALVPFEMCDLMLGPWPSIPPLRRFPELNVRTYVHCEGRGGIWFFSLDADCWPIVFGGRFFYRLPYFKARMRHEAEGGAVRFESQRVGGGPRFKATYMPTGAAYFPKIGTFEHWMAERYCLYTRIAGDTHRLEVHHRPWPIQRAEVEITESNMLESELLASFEAKPVCHFSPGVEVVTFRALKTDDILETVASPLPIEQVSNSRTG